MPTSTEVCLMAGRRASNSGISLVETGTPSPARHRFAPSIPLRQFRRLNWGILLFMLLGVSLAAQAQVSGTVFRDFNANGVRDGASEVGVGGVSVTAFNTAGVQVATTTSTTAGAYSLTGLTFPVRIQFGNLGGADFTGPSGSDSQSSVQFYSAATTTANFGVNNPSDYCQAAPTLFTTCFTNGSRSLSNPSENDVLVAIPNGAALSGTVQHLATAPNMGSVWGVAYDRVNKIVYTSAFLKRHSDFGPQGISGLYWGRYTGSALSSQGSIALNTISGNIFGTNPRSDGVAPDDNLTGVSYNQPSYDRDVYQNVAKLGIGDIDLSPDGKTLYVMNLTQRRLAAFDVSAVASGGNPTYLGSYAITDPGCSGGQFRPFGIKVVSKDLIYVGVTCSGETSQNRADLMAYICRIVPSAGFSATSAIVPVTAIQPPSNATFSASGFIPPVPPTNAIPLYYNKVWPSEYGNAFESQNYIYEPWKTAWPTTQSVFSAPQPLLSDIEINRNGDLVLGIMDRMGHMAGYNNYDISGTSNALYSDFAYGDILYVCNKGTTGNPIYYLEGHPQCPAPATNPNFHGPGGREYFNDATPSHREGAQGGLVLLPQENYTVTGMMDPGTVTYTTGLTVFNNATGASTQALTLAGNDFGKAGGVGDMEVTCDPAPIEIGNRVWKDIDNDGIQDAGEPPLAGVTLSLFASCTGTAIATAVTDANGNYYFSSAAGTSTASNRYGLNLSYGASYCVRVTSLGSDTSVSGLSLTSLSPAPGEVSGSPNSSTTVANNDAFLESGQPTIRLVTGSSGENNHTYDIGFPGSCSMVATVTAGLCASATNTYSATAVVQLTNSTAGVLTVSTGSQSQTFTTTAATSATFTAVFTGLVSNGASQTVTASLPGCSTTTATYTAPTSCSVAPCGVNLAVTPGLCLSATNSYVLSGTITTTNVPVSGTLTITSAAFTPRSLTLPAGNSTGTFSYSGLVSNGQTYTVTASYSNSACAPVSQTYTAPVSCSVAPVCSLSAVVTAGLCASATNTYSATAVVTVQNPVAGVLTVINGAQSATLTTSNATGSVSYTAVFAGLVSDGASRTVTASLPGCSTATTTYTAPASCSVAPVCSLTATVTAGVCASATNTYSATAVVRLTNPTAGVLTVTNGAQSLTFATTAVSSATYTATFTGLVSDGASHTVVASLPGCSTTTTTYTAPASCSVAPVCSLTAAVTAGLCASATNTYSATAVVQLTNPVAGVLTVTNGAQSLTFATTAAPSAVYTVEFPGLVSDGVSHTVTASLPGCGTTTATYTAPASCSVALVCSLTAAVTAGVCASATNTYSATAVVRLTNPTAGVLTVINGAQSLTFATTATSSATYTAVFNGLISDGASHTVTASLPGCSTTIATYTAPASCSVAPVCSLSATVTAGVCASATNTYSATALVTIQNPVGGVLTVSNGPASITASIPAGSGQVVFPAIFNGLTSDGVSHTVVASLPGCSTTTTTYTAPASCTVAPVCSLTAAVTAGLCASATNTYSATAVVQLTNSTAGVLTVTNGAQSLTFATTAVSSATYTAVFNGLTSDGASHTVVASLPGCSTTTTTYTAPASCTVAPVCSLTAAVTAGLCASATNTYSATAVVQLTNPTAGVLTVTNGAQSLTFATTAVSSATYTAVFNGLTSDGASHTVVASLPGCSTTTTTYTAPASCTVAPVCSLTAAVTAGICASATNT
ncbi:SdrD B-like domain-containing protein, partial [Spirosoma terrae]